eukprot:UN3619
MFCPSSDATLKVQATGRREVRDGDVVRLRARSGRYLSVDDNRVVTAVAARSANSDSMEFIVHTGGTTELKHRGCVYFEQRSTGVLLDADEDEEYISARWTDRGIWQRFALEKPLPDDLPPVTPVKSRSRKQEELSALLASSATPVKRKASQLSISSSSQPRLASQVETPKRRRSSCKINALQDGEDLEVPIARAVRVR